jgi:predicted neuraminidase
MSEQNQTDKPETDTKSLVPPQLFRCPDPFRPLSSRAFQGISSLACGAEGRQYAVWYAGPTPREDRNNYVVLAVSEDAGATWEERLIIDPDGPGPVRAFDPELWLAPDGNLWIFWAQETEGFRPKGHCGVWGMSVPESEACTPDCSWTNPRRLCDGVMMCKPLALTDGTWALPVSFWGRRQERSAGMVVSTDFGATWSESGACTVPESLRRFDEHMIVERRDGSLWMLVRTKRGIDESLSVDGGRTWSELQPSGIPHVDSRFFIRRLASGNLLLVRHHPVDGTFADGDKVRGTRSHLTAYLSEDDGATWVGGLLLDDRIGVSYPDGDQAADGTIWITYDFQRRGEREILLAAFSEDDIRAGGGNTPPARLRQEISVPPPVGFDFEIEPPNLPNDGVLFVDNAKEDRSGHLGHALVEYAPGKILAFYANCDGEANEGHNGIGWMEYKRSEDGGRTWSDPMILDYSKKVFDEGKGWSVMCEKALLAADGTILLFTLASDISSTPLWRPFGIPVMLRSTDDGRTWSDPVPVSDQRGRVYDVLRYQDSILVLEFCNDGTDTWTGTLPEHVYRLYVSTDNGKSFSPRSTLPFDTLNRGYGTMELLPDGSLIAYVYNEKNESNLDYVISRDGGHTWEEPRISHLAKQIRNPQMGRVKEGYVLHGRSGNWGEDGEKGNFVLYTSRDGILWDKGRYLQMQTAGHGSYSNNLIVHDPDGGRERLLIQSSYAYDKNKTNVHHWWLT